MVDEYSVFGEVRSLLNLPRMNVTQRTQFLGLVEQLQRQHPTRYTEEILPYIQGYVHHFEGEFYDAHDLESFERVHAVLPHALIGLSFQFTALGECTAFEETWPSVVPASFSQLCRLDLSAVHDQGMGGFAQLVHSPALVNLDTLRFPEDVHGDAIIASIATAPALGQLHSLSLRRSLVTDVGVDALARSTMLPALSILLLDENQIGPRGVQTLLNTQTLGSLDVVSLNGNPIGDDGFAQYIHSNYLDTAPFIDMTSARLTDISMATLASSEVLYRYQSVLLAHNAIGNDGVSVLADLTGPTQVRVLDLSCNPIDPQAWLALSRSTAFPELAILFVQGNVLDEAARDALRESPHFADTFELIY